MSVDEIINRKETDPLTQEEALFIIKEYVKERKGRDIVPEIYHNQPTPFVVMQLQLMGEMACHAIGWFKNNKLKTERSIFRSVSNKTEKPQAN